MSTFENENETRYEQIPVDAAKPAAYCQNCGKGLDQESMRVVGPAVYCEPCLAARLSGAPTGGAGSTAGAGTAWTPGTWMPNSTPNPALAGLLGVIPGVGAMYNEQYAKGLFHLVVFAVLISLSQASGFFGLFAFGWICYMVIEAHHTARARRDGTPLPNPFGLNDLGERLGFGKAWPAAGPAGQPPAGGAAGPAAGTYAAAAAGYAASAAAMYGTATNTGYVPPVTAGYPPAAGAWGAPEEAYDPAGAYAAASGGANPAYAQGYAPGYPQGYAPGYGGQSYGGQSYGPMYGAPGYGAGYVPPVPPVSPYTPVPPAPMVDPSLVPRANRFPAGAVWLIGLGTIFLLSTTGVFHTLFGWTLVGFVLIGLAVWIFLRRMMDTGASLANDGTAGYPVRIVRALGPSVWVLMVGALLLLNEYDLLPWRRSWPLFIILAGVMALLQRAAYNTAATSAFEAVQTPPASAAARAPEGNPYSIVPSAGAPLSRTESGHDASGRDPRSTNDEGAL